MRVDYDAFLRWAYPNPMGNLVRGHLAEYLVGQALGCAGAQRAEWEPHDLVTDTGVRIEVKAAGKRQAWVSHNPSPSGFGVGAPDASDLHVFAWHTDIKDDADPTDSDEWRFFVLPTAQLSGRRSIRLSVLRTLTDEVSWEMLPAVVRAATDK